MIESRGKSTLDFQRIILIGRRIAGEEKTSQTATMRIPPGFVLNRPEAEIEVELEDEDEAEASFDRAVRIYVEESHELAKENKIKGLEEELEYMRQILEVWKYRSVFDKDYSYYQCYRKISDINTVITDLNIEHSRLTMRPRFH